MSIFLREPNPGDRISANLIRDIIRAIKEIRPIAGHGMKLKRGPNGTTFDATVPPPVSGAASVQPWTFVCKKSEGEDGKEKREGGWVNCKVQIGYKLIEVKEGIDKTDDGTYLCVCDLTHDNAKVEVVRTGEPSDYGEGYNLEKNTISFYVGTVYNGKQTKGPHMYPVAYKVL